LLTRDYTLLASLRRHRYAKLTICGATPHRPLDFTLNPSRHGTLIVLHTAVPNGFASAALHFVFLRPSGAYPNPMGPGAGVRWGALPVRLHCQSDFLSPCNMHSAQDSVVGSSGLPAVCWASIKGPVSPHGRATTAVAFRVGATVRRDTSIAVRLIQHIV
jgi:hypothetical protein